MNSNSTIIGPINVGNPCEITVKELAELIIRITKSGSSIIFKELPDDDPKKRKPDITLAKKYLDWEPKVDLVDGLKATISYFNGCYQ